MKMSKNKKFYYKDKDEASIGRAAIFVKLALILVVIMVMITSLNMLVRLTDLNVKKAELEGQIEEKREHIEELNYYINSPFDADYIIRVARDELGLVLPEEKVYYTGKTK